VGAVEHVDRVELQTAHVLHEAAQAAGAQRGGPGPGEVLTLQEERADGVQGDRSAPHAPAAYHRRPSAARQSVAPALHRAQIMRKLSVALAALLVFGFSPLPASAGAPTDQLRKQVDEVLRVLEDPELKAKASERHDAIRRIAGEVFDYNEMARRSLGTHWNARTPEERREFVALFADLIDRAYFSKIDLYQGEKVRYGSETVDGDQATVKTAIIGKDGKEIPVDYRMHQSSGRWTVYDVNIQGISLVANYRTQFNRVVTTESYESLVQRLRDKDATPAASPSSGRTS
jgi:phospholipid transport system substrate-binding protein